MHNTEIIKELKALLEDLCASKYGSIREGIRHSRIDPADFRRVLRDYGGTLTMPPDQAFEEIELQKIAGKEIYGLDFDLWIDGEQSDLTLIMDYAFDGNGKVSEIVVNDLEVM